MEAPDIDYDYEQQIQVLTGLMEDVQCAFPVSFGLTRFIFISVGCVLALMGILFNSILSWAFVTHRLIYEPNLALLAVLDGLLCISYITIFGGAEAFAHYLQIALVYDCLHAYAVYGYMFCKVVQLAIPCMLILSLLQRWCWITKRRVGGWSILHMPRGRGILGVIVVTTAFLTRVPLLFSIEVHAFPNCTDHFRTKEIWPTDLFKSSWYSAYDLCLTCAQVFVPFLLLLVLNGSILSKLRKKRRHRQRRMEELGRGRKQRRRYATAHLHDLLIMRISGHLMQEVENLVQSENNAMMTMAVIVASYLICNSLHAVLIIFENWASHLLFNDGGWTDHYIVASDVINFLFMVSSAIRLPIYYKYNPHLRRHLKPLLHTIYKRRKKYSYKAVLVRHQEDMNAIMASTFYLTGTNQRKYGTVLAYTV